MATQDIGAEYGRISLDRRQRNGSIGLVLIIAVVLIGAAMALLLVGRGQAQPYILGFLALLATIGVFSLFAIASGIWQISGQDNGDPLFKALAESSSDGTVVTDAAGRVLYANSAYLTLVNATDRNDVRPVERAFIGDPHVSEAVYRLLKAGREGRRLQEEVRVAAPKGEAARWLRLRVRPLEDDKRQAGRTVWTVAEVTRDRERQENAFQELQHAIDYLDHAPAGFFSADAKGEIVYLNATLAGWLDQDLAQVGSGGLKLSDIMRGDGAALLSTIVPRPGDVKTEIFDLDLKTRGGRSVPARLLHKVAFAADGTVGASRTLVLNRARDDGSDPQRAAEVRFMRFFQHTPMAIATVDKAGKIGRSNPLFARLFQGVLQDEQGSKRSVLAVVAERDRESLETALRHAFEGQGDIAPVDAALV